MRTKWIELKDLCEQYLEKKDSITSITDMMTLLEVLGSYMLFGESMYSEPTEEEKRKDQMKAEKMLKLVQDGEACSAEINETVMEGVEEDIAADEDILREIDEFYAEEARKKAEAEMAKKETDNASSSSPTTKK